ncbi:hypothetical protein KBY48_22595 [Streptomyces sp. RT42]|nr:hypothetical protein [Streptomyces sp. RT42]
MLRAPGLAVVLRRDAVCAGAGPDSRSAHAGLPADILQRAAAYDVLLVEPFPVQGSAGPVGTPRDAVLVGERGQGLTVDARFAFDREEGHVLLDVAGFCGSGLHVLGHRVFFLPAGGPRS